MHHLNSILGPKEIIMQRVSQFEGLLVDEFTSVEPLVVVEDDSIAKILTIFEEISVRHLPVINSNNEVVGIISERDLIKLLAFKNLSSIHARDIMTPSPYSVISGTYLVDAVFKMSELKIGSLLVENKNGTLMGIFTSTDALNALVEVLRGEILSQ